MQGLVIFGTVAAGLAFLSSAIAAACVVFCGRRRRRRMMADLGEARQIVRAARDYGAGWLD